jgi:hypothetical protein
MSPAHVADIVSEQEGLETKRGVFEIADGVLTCTGEITHRFIFDLGDIHRREVPRAGQAGEWHSISAVGCDPVAGLFGDQRGGHHPTVVPFFHQVAGEPGATRAGFIDKDEVCGL